MGATTAIAIYAALVATGALAVQAAQWRSARTRLKVDANAGLAPIAGGGCDETHKRGEVVFVQLTNRSPHPIKITHVGMLTVGRKDKKGLFFARPYPLHLQLPLEIPARDNVTLWQPRDQLEKWELRRLRIVIRTAAGDGFHSRRFLIEDLVRLETVP
jgi:hypothetical protein